MTAAEVKTKIHGEIGNQWGVKNAHGVDIRTCLVEPELREYCFPGENNTPRNSGLCSGNIRRKKRGYSIVYSELMDTFGLAIRTKQGQDICIGYYDSFMETLKGM